MALLDDLSSQVEKIKEEEARRHAELKEQEAFYESALKPVMLRAHNYFEEVVESLNIIQPDISVKYPLDPSKLKAVTLNQEDYFFHSDNSRHPRQIDVLAHCTLDRPKEFYVPTMDGASNLSDLLNEYQFPHHRKNKLDQSYNVRGATFILEGPMKVHIRFTANSADRCINVLLRNLEAQPTKRYQFEPERLNDELLERLANMLIREETKLVEVEVSDALRKTLQHQIETAKREKAEDLAKAYAEIEVAKQLAEESKLGRRAKRAITKGNYELARLISRAAKLKSRPGKK